MSIFYTNKTITMNRGDSGVVLLSILNRDDTPFALPIGMKNPTIVFSVKAETDANDLNGNMLIEEYMPIKDYTYYGYGTQNAEGQMQIHGGFYPKSKTVNTEESVLDTGIIYKVLANKKYMFVVSTTTPPVYPISLTKREYAFAVPLVFEPAFTDRLSPGTYTYSITLLDSTSPVQLTQGEGDNATTVDNYSEFLANVTLKQDLFGSQKLILSDSPIARVHGDPIRRVYYIQPCSVESVANATASEITTGNVTNIVLPPVYIATTEQLGGVIVGETLQVDVRGVLNVSEEITNKIADLYNKIGDMKTLTTDEKTTLVGAINEVDAHADTAQQTADNAVGLANTGISKADAAQATANSATELANTGISKADQAQATANDAVAAANNSTTIAQTAETNANNAVENASAANTTAAQAKTIAEQAKTIASNSAHSVGFADIESAVIALNGYDNTYFSIGDSIFLKEQNVPDMWVYGISDNYLEYTYTTDEAFINTLLNDQIQIGYYILVNLESSGDYDVLKNKPIINQDLSADGFVPVENTYYRHTGTTSETYTAGVIYFYNGTAYKAIDGAGGEVPTALPQTAGALKSGNLPTSGWGVSASLWTGSEVMPYNPGYIGNIGKSWATSQEQLAELPNGWQATMNGTLYANRTARLDGDSPTRGIQFGITGAGAGADEAFVRIYTNGDIYVWNNKSSVTRTITQIGCSLLSKQTYTISDTSITANSDILMELTDEGGVKSYSMEAGKITVIRDTVPTSPIPYTYKVKQTNASGQFTVINHYVPVVSSGGDGGSANYTKVESTIPTSAWVSSAPSWIGQDALTWNTNEGSYYTQGAEDLGLSVGGSYSAVLTIDGTDYESENSQIMDEGGMPIYVAYFNNYAVMLQIIDHCVGFGNDGPIAGNGYLVMVIPMGGTVPSSVIVKSFSGAGEISAIISNSAIKVNSAVTMYIDYNGKIKAKEKTDGSITLSASATPTVDIPYAIEITDTNTEGLFEVINSYVPDIPDIPTIPTALPQTTSAIKTGTWTAGETEITITDSDITATSDVDVNISHKGEVIGELANSGAFTITSEVVPISNIQFTYKVKQTNGTGQINIINSYIPAVSDVVLLKTITNTSTNVYIAGDASPYLFTVTDNAVTASKFVRLYPNDTDTETWLNTHTISSIITENSGSFTFKVDTDTLPSAFSITYIIESLQ